MSHTVATVSPERPRPGAAPPRRADSWDVASWVFGPRLPFRLNTSFRLDDGAVVTASGCFDHPSAAAELIAALRPFEQLDRVVVVDLFHADLGELAATTLVEAGLRRSSTVGGFSVVVVNANAATRLRLARAGGALLLRPHSL